MITQLQCAFTESDLFKKLESFLSRDASIQLDFMQFYPHDLLVMFFKDTFLNEEHLKLVKKRLDNYCKSKYSMCFKNLSCLVTYHLALESLKQELHLFAKFARLNPKIIDTILKSDNLGTNLCLTASKIICHNLSHTK